MQRGAEMTVFIRGYLLKGPIFFWKETDLFLPNNDNHDLLTDFAECYQSGGKQPQKSFDAMAI